MRRRLPKRVVPLVDVMLHPLARIGHTNALFKPHIAAGAVRYVGGVPCASRWAESAPRLAHDDLRVCAPLCPMAQIASTLHVDREARA